MFPQNMMDDSPFYCHLHTNFAPSDHGSEEIKRFLLEPLAKLSNIEREISRVQLTLARLIQERDSLKQVVDAHRAILSPVRRLPHDILEEIFFHCLPSDRNPIMSSKEAPLLLGRICSVWRTTSLSTPRLWDSIHIHIPPSVREKKFGFEVMLPESDPFIPYEEAVRISALRSFGLQQWLDRSGSRPLRISLYSEGNSTQVYPAVLQTLVSFSHRWRELIFLGPIPDFTSVKVLTDDDLPLLRSLHIHNIACENWKPTTLLCPNRLRRVSLTSVTHNYRAYPFDWSQLTELNLRSFKSENRPDTLSVSDALHVLMMSPRLVKCYLAVHNSIEVGVDRPSQKPLVELPFLEELGISIHLNLQDFFQSLHLPAIRELEYHIKQSNPFFQASDWKPKEPLLNFLTRCGGTLRSLDFTPDHFTSLEIQEYLVETPFLTRLIFNQYLHSDMALRHPAWVLPQSSSPPALDDIFIGWLTPNPENTDACLLPHLEEFQCKAFSSFSDESLSAFIRRRRSRYEGIACLRRVHAILTHLYREDGIIHDSPPYAEEGLQGEIIYARPPARTKYSASKGIPFSPQEIAYLAPVYFL